MSSLGSAAAGTWSTCTACCGPQWCLTWSACSWESSLPPSSEPTRIWWAQSKITELTPPHTKRGGKKSEWILMWEGFKKSHFGVKGKRDLKRDSKADWVLGFLLYLWVQSWYFASLPTGHMQHPTLSNIKLRTSVCKHLYFSIRLNHLQYVDLSFLFCYSAKAFFSLSSKVCRDWFWVPLPNCIVKITATKELLLWPANNNNINIFDSYLS